MIRFTDETIREAWKAYCHALGDVDGCFRAAAAVFEAAANEQVQPINVVFDRGPGPEAPRFIDVEDALGRSISVGEWHQGDDGKWPLRIDAAQSNTRDCVGGEEWRCGDHCAAPACGPNCISRPIPDAPAESAGGCETEAAYWRRRAETVERELTVEKHQRERAEAAIERARAEIEALLRAPSEHPRDEGIDEALTYIAGHLGLTITPARELTVTWEGSK
jgi:hypothetical protein